MLHSQPMTLLSSHRQESWDSASKAVLLGEQEPGTGPMCLTRRPFMSIYRLLICSRPPPETQEFNYCQRRGHAAVLRTKQRKVIRFIVRFSVYKCDSRKKQNKTLNIFLESKLMPFPLPPPKKWFKMAEKRKNWLT